MKVNKPASSAVSASRKSFEFKLATKIKDKKSFYTYVRSKVKSRIKVGPLVDSDGKVSCDASDIAEALNEQFASVFTEQDLAQVQVAENLFLDRPGSKLETIEITVTDVCRHLTLLREDKSPGADDISPRILTSIST